MPFDPSAWMKIKYGSSERRAVLGYEDPVLKQGKWRRMYPILPEFDPYFYDPNVTDSRVSMIDGEDSTRYANYGMIGKHMGMSTDEYRTNVLYRQNPTIKNIYEKWDISPQHPGMQFRMHPFSEFEYAKWQGQIMNTYGLLKNFGGKYFDAPNGEQCFTKTWACAKIAFVWAFSAWIFDVAAGTRPVGWRNRAWMFGRISYLPLSAAATWGATSCLLCSIRQKEDNWNYLWGSISFGTIFGLRMGPIVGGYIAAVAMIATMGWRAFIDGEEGVTGTNKKMDGYFNYIGPLSREYVGYESHYRDVPTVKKF